MSKISEIEKYIIEHKKYPKELIRFSSEFMPEWVLQKAVPKILSKESIASGRRQTSGNNRDLNINSVSQDEKKANKEPKMGKTPAFVLLNRMYWGKGVLNTPGMHAGNNFDLSTPSGMALFLHEAFHVYQWFRNPVKMIFYYILSPFVSLIRCGILFAHEVIPFEVEAIKFQKEVEKKLNSKEYVEKLKIFKDF